MCDSMNSYCLISYSGKLIFYGLVLELVDSLDLKSSGIYSRGGSSPPEATRSNEL